MWAWIPHELGTGDASRAVAVLADSGIKGVVLMALAGVSVLLMRGSAASARHLVWMLALVGLLFLPVISLLVPTWQLPILPAVETPALVQDGDYPAIADSEIPSATEYTGPVATPVVETPRQPAGERTPTSVTSPPSPVQQTQAPPPAPTPTPVKPAVWLLATWLTVAVALLLPLLTGLVVLRRMVCRATPFPTEALPRLTHELAKAIGFHRPVTLLRAPHDTMPMAAGFFRPVVFLPADAESWNDEKCRAVLLHELAHVKRRDCLTHAVAHLAVSFYWFNPLAWLALRQLRIEREHACDDLVLAAGEGPTEYAEILLDVARSLRARPLTATAAITMAKKSHLEGRLLAVLDAARNRGLLTRRSVFGFAFVGALMTAALSTLHITRAESTVVVDHLTFSSGVEVTLLGVGVPYDESLLWTPDGRPLSTVPHDLLDSESVYTTRQLYFRPSVPEDLAGAEDIALQCSDGSGVTIQFHLDAGSNMEQSSTWTISTKDTTFDATIGVAAGAWETLAKTQLEGGAQGVRGGVSYDMMVGKPFKRDDDYLFTLTNNVTDLDKRVVVYDSAGKMHYTPATGMAPGINGTNLGEYSLDGVAPEEVRFVELQVREYEWRTFRNIAVNPGADATATREAEAEDLRTEVVVDHLTFSSGVEVTLLGVGTPRDDNTPPWKPDGTPLNDPPEIGPGSYMTPLHDDSRLVRHFYQRTTTPEDLPAGESVSIRYGGLTQHNIPAGDTTVVSVAHRMDEDASRVDIDVGVAAGAWEPLAQTIAENGAQGTRKGVTYNILVGKPFKRDDAYHFTLTHDVVDLDKRVVVFDSLGKMHYTPGTGTSPGSGGTHMGEYSLGDVAPEEVRAVELQVREYEWRTYRNIALRPVQEEKEQPRDQTATPQPPEITLTPHDYYKSGDSIYLRLSVENSPDIVVADALQVRSGGNTYAFEHLPFRHNRRIGGPENDATVLEVPHDATWLQPGLNRISVLVKDIEVFPPNWDEAPAPAKGTFKFDTVESNEVTFEVVSEIPASYFEPVYEAGWDAQLDQHLAGVYFKSIPDQPDLLYRYQLVPAWQGQLPFNLAAAPLLEVEGESAPLSLGYAKVEADAIAPDYWVGSTQLEALFPELIGKRVRLKFYPSVSAARQNPALRRYYGRDFTTRWMRLKPAPEWVKETLAKHGVRDVIHYDKLTQPDRYYLEEVGLTFAAVASGGFEFKGSPRAPCLLQLEDPFALKEGMAQVQNAPETLQASTISQAAVPPDELSYFAALNEKGETWFLLCDTSARGTRNVYLWRAPEEQAASEETASFPPPTVTLSAHDFQKVGMPVMLRIDSGVEALETSISKITIRCDGEEIPWFSSVESGVKMMLGADYSASPRHPLEGLPAGKHRVSVLLRDVEVRPRSGADREAAAVYPTVETNEVEFEVLPEIPADYFRPTMEDGWNSMLDNAFADLRVQDPDDKPVVLYLDWRNVESIERPFALAFDVAMEEQTSGTTHPVGRMTADAWPNNFSPRQHISLTMDNDDARELFRKWSGKQVRLVLTPSPEAALEDPAIRSYYGEVHTTEWVVLKPELTWNVDRILAPYGVDHVMRYGTSDVPYFVDGASRYGISEQTILIEDWGVTCKAILDGGAVVRDPESDTRFMPLKDIVLPGAALDYIDQHLQELDESEVREIAIAPDALNYIGVRAPSGEVWILLVDTNRFGEREVYRWQVPPSPSAQVRPGWLRLEFRAHELLARSGDYRTVLVRNHTRLLRVESDLTGVDQPEGNELLQIVISGGPGRPARYGHVTTPNLGTRRELERTNGLTPGSDQITKEYILRRSWDGAHVGVPALVTPNRMMRVSDVWRTWRSANDSRTIEYTDDHGWRFVAHGAGWSPRAPEEMRYPLLSLFECYRPNGTLYSRTELTEGRPDTTHFFAMNGITLDGQTRLTWDEQDGTASLMDYTWRTGKGQYRRYVGTPSGIVRYEEVLALVDGEFLVQERLHHAPDSEIQVFELDMDAIVGPLADFRQETRDPDLAVTTDTRGRTRSTSFVPRDPAASYREGRDGIPGSPRS